MAKVKIKTDRALSKIKSAFEDVLKSDALFVEITDFSIKRIQQKARLSKRMIENSEDSASLPELSKGYIRQRKELTRGEDGTDSEFFLPNVRISQLTFTGQLLKSLKGKITKRGKNIGTIELSFQGRRKDGQLNANLYNDLLRRNSSYEILALSKKAIQLIRNKVLTRLRQELIRKKLK